MAKIDVYENSKFATFLSALGWLGMPVGVYCIFNKEEGLGVGVGVIILAIAVALKFLAYFLDRFVGRIKGKKAAKKNKIKNEGVSSDSGDSQEQAKAQAALCEFVKYKELFSKGSITREEYDAKTSELFKDYVKPKKQ